MLYRLLKILLFFFFFVLLIGIIGLGLIHFPPIQSKIADIALEKVNEQFATQIEVDKVDIDFWGNLEFKGVHIKDQHDLTFIETELLKIKVSYWDIYLDQKNIKVKSLSLYNPNIQILTYKGEEKSNFVAFIDHFKSNKDPDKQIHLNADIDIINGTISIIDENIHLSPSFFATEVNADINDLILLNKGIKARIENLSMRYTLEGKTIPLRKLRANFSYEETQLVAEDFIIETDQTYLQGDLILSYTKENGLKNISTQVDWNFKLNKGSKIADKDLALLLDRWDKKNITHLNFHAKGRLKDLSFSHIELSHPDLQLSANQLNLTHVFVPGSLGIEAQNLDFKSSYTKLLHYLPSHMSETIDNFIHRFGDIHYQGDFYLDSSKITSDAKIKTSIGLIVLKTTIDNYKDESLIHYQGKLTATDLAISQIVKIEKLGNLTGHLNFNGTGTAQKLHIQTDGILSTFSFDQKNLDNTHIDGVLTDQWVEAKLNFNNPMIKGIVDGLYHYKNKPHKISFTTRMDYLNLTYFGLSKEPNTQVYGKAKGSLSFTTLDDLLGEIEIEDLIYLNNEKSRSFDSISFGIDRKSDTNKRVHINLPNTLNGYVEGDFILSEVQDIIQNAFGRMILDYQAIPVSKGQEFDFDFTLNNAFFELFYPNIEIEANTRIHGEANTNKTPDFNFDFISRGIKIGQQELGYTNLTFNTQAEHLLWGKINHFTSGNTFLKDIILKADPHDDRIIANLKAELLNDNFPAKFDLNLYQKLDAKKQIIIGFTESTILLDDKKWKINTLSQPENNFLRLDLKRKKYTLTDISITRENQSLTLSGVYLNPDNFSLNVLLKNLSLESFIPKGKDGSQWKGEANGTIEINKTRYAVEPTINLKIKDITLDDYLLGTLDTKSVYNREEKVYDVHSSLTKGMLKTLVTTGFIDNKKNEPHLSLRSTFQEFDMKLIQKFIGNSVEKFRGKLHGSMNFSGPISDLDYDGQMEIEDLGLKIPYTRVDYFFPGRNDLILLKGDDYGFFLLNQYKMEDSTFKTKGLLDGYISFKNLKTWGADISLTSDNLLLMDNNAQSNESFYGRIFGEGNYNIQFNEEGLDISAIVKVNKGSKITVNMDTEREFSKSTLVKFVDFNNLEATEESFDDTIKGLTLDFDIDMDENSQIEMIFDAETGDAVEVRGRTERMKFKLNKLGDMTFDGEYDIRSGDYKFRRIISKNFAIRKESYIQFSGDPAKAKLDIIAAYPKTVNNVGEYLGSNSSQNLDVELIIKMGGDLDNATIDFDIEIPGASQQIQQELETKLSTVQEVRNQFGAILTLGQFLTENEISVSSTASSTIELALNQIASIISNLDPDFKLNFEYSSSNQFSSTSNRIKTSINYSFNPRVSINGSVGVPLNGEYNEKITGEFEAELDVTKEIDGNLLLRAFSRPTSFGIENFTGNTSGYAQSYGAGIVLRREFNNLDELFPKKENDKLQLESSKTPK